MGNKSSRKKKAKANENAEPTVLRIASLSIPEIYPSDHHLNIFLKENPGYSSSFTPRSGIYYFTCDELEELKINSLQKNLSNWSITYGEILNSKECEIIALPAQLKKFIKDLPTGLL